MQRFTKLNVLQSSTYYKAQRITKLNFNVVVFMYT